MHPPKEAHNPKEDTIGEQHKLSHTSLLVPAKSEQGRISNIPNMGISFFNSCVVGDNPMPLLLNFTISFFFDSLSFFEFKTYLVFWIVV